MAAAASDLVKFSPVCTPLPIFRSNSLNALLIIWVIGNGELGMGNGEWGIGNGESGIGNWLFVICYLLFVIRKRTVNRQQSTVNSQLKNMITGELNS